MIELKVDKENDDICYNDKYHIYWDKKDLFTYISATTIIGLYEQEFDRPFWLQYKAFQRLCNPSRDILTNLREIAVFDRKVLSSKYPVLATERFDDTVRQIDEEWVATNKNACEKGTNIHSGFEDKFDERGWYELSWYGFEKEKRFLYIPNKHEFSQSILRQVIPEMLISMKTESGVRIAGQIDLPVKDGNEIYVLDYKSNAKLKFESYKKPSGAHTMMKEPLSHLMDCNMSHYQLQLSLYQFMLRRKYSWLKPNDLTIIHVADGINVRHVVDYIPRDIVNMCCNFRDFHQEYTYKKIIKDEEGRYFLPG